MKIVCQRIPNLFGAFQVTTPSALTDCLPIISEDKEEKRRTPKITNFLYKVL